MSDGVMAGTWVRRLFRTRREPVTNPPSVNPPTATPHEIPFPRTETWRKLAGGIKPMTLGPHETDQWGRVTNDVVTAVLIDKSGELERTIGFGGRRHRYHPGFEIRIDVDHLGRRASVIAEGESYPYSTRHMELVNQAIDIARLSPSPVHIARSRNRPV